MNTTGSEMPSSTGSLLEFSSDDDVDDKYTHTHHADASQNDDGRQSSIRQRMEREKQELLVRWRQENEQSRVVNRLPTIYLPDAIDTCCTNAEVVLSNMPLTIGAVGLSWVSLGVVWFKFMEETAGVCHPRRYHDAACTYSEFPGCFECDTSNHYYKAALTFHTVCNGVGAVCALLFLCKVILAWQVVADELKNPATATPVGVVCITVVCVAAGRGLAGEAIVIATSIFHVLLAFWFLYTAIVQFRLLPDPGWFPNTVGIRCDLMW